MSNDPIIYDTQWYGIYVQKQNGRYWLISDAGDEKHCGADFPSASVQENFMLECVKNNFSA